MKSEMENERILIVVAHPDDEILGFGGGMALLSDKNIFKIAILSGDVDKRQYKPTQYELENDCRSANNNLGVKDIVLGNFVNLCFNNVPHIEIVKWIETIILEFKPTIILTHHPDDLNNDHLIVSEATLVASKIPFRNALDFKIKILAYMEILSSTDWSTKSNFKPNCFVGVGKINIERKINSLFKYQGVMREYPHSRSRETVFALAALRGSQSNQLYAEALQIVHSIFN
jgi:LmbE family N-acetylglucosaminyl deacetylase